MSIRSIYHRFICSLVLSLFAVACRQDPPNSVPTPVDPAASITASKVAGGGGLNIAVYEAGIPSGPPILFIQGFTGSHLSWQSQFAQSLAKDFRLVTYEFRGHGASDKPLDPALYTNSALWADDLDAVIRAKNLDRPVLVGWSYGGYVIADYVRKFGDSGIGGVVFVGAVTKQGTQEAAGFLTNEVLALFPDVLSPDVQKSINGTRAITKMFGHPELRGAAWEDSFASAMMVPPEVRLAMFSRVLDNDDVLTAIRVPALVVQGNRDGLVRVSAANHITSKIPGAELLLYDRIGHAPHMETPERFNTDLAKFVRSTR